MMRVTAWAILICIFMAAPALAKDRIVGLTATYGVFSKCGRVVDLPPKQIKALRQRCVGKAECSFKVGDHLLGPKGKPGELVRPNCKQKAPVRPYLLWVVLYCGAMDSGGMQVRCFEPQTVRLRCPYDAMSDEKWGCTGKPMPGADKIELPE